MAGYGPGPSYSSSGDDPSFAPESGLDVRAREFVPGAAKSNQRRDKRFDGNRDFSMPSRGGRSFSSPDGRRLYVEYVYQPSRTPHQGQDGATSDRQPQHRRPNFYRLEHKFWETCFAGSRLSTYFSFCLSRGKQWTPQNAGRNQGARAAMVAGTASLLASSSSNNVPEQGHMEPAGRQPQRQPNKYFNR